MLTGTVLVDRYELSELLGAGGSGSTYRAMPLGIKSSSDHQASVAIKILSLQHLQDWKQLELFEREAQVLAQLSHPQIPQYLEYFHIDAPANRAFYLVQQLAPGRPLTAWVQSGWRATEAEVWDIARQLLEILQYLHQQSPPLIHRDIKPHNIIRNDDGRVFLVDFGAVQNVYQNTLLKGSTVAGTYGYMSPEQFRGAAVPASDLYGLGATVLYLLTHRSPADLPQERLKLKFRDHVNISEHFADWLETMLETDVIDRFLTAEKALIALKNPNFRVQHQTPQEFSQKAKEIFTGALLALFLIYQHRYALLNKLGLQPIGLCSNEKGINISVINDYLDHGGDPNIKVDASWRSSAGLNPSNMNPLLLNCAISFGNVEVVSTLLNHGADPNIHDYNQSTPQIKLTSLHEAIAAPINKEIIEMLLKHGANPNLTDQQGNTPLHYLAAENIIPTYHVFPGRDKCFHKDEWLFNMFKLFVRYKADPNLSNNDGDTALHLTARNDRNDEYDYMVALGWNPLQKNNLGETPQQIRQPSEFIFCRNPKK
jgi:serine/threonine protein kinase